MKKKLEKAKEKKQLEKENFMLKKRHAKGPNPLSVKKKVHLPVDN